MFDIYQSSNPYVSVIMPTYNRAEYLSRSISSFINQTYTNCELLVVDDGSEDRTFQVVNKYTKKYENIRYLMHRHKKLSLTKNTRIKAAAGKFIAFLDSDDVYKPDYLEKRVEFMQINESVSLIEGGVVIIGDPYVKDKNDLSKKINLSKCLIGSTFFGKAEVFATIGGFDKNVLYELRILIPVNICDEYKSDIVKSKYKILFIGVRFKTEMHINILIYGIHPHRII